MPSCILRLGPFAKETDFRFPSLKLKADPCPVIPEFDSASSANAKSEAMLRVRICRENF